MDNTFEKIFKRKNPRKYRSPGRINLIGEHIDYNGGMVLPMSLSIATYGWVLFNNTNYVNCFSNNYSQEGVISFDITKELIKDRQWTSYVKAVIDTFIKKGYQINKGFDLFIDGNIPSSSGLSSSASIELLTAVILKDLFKLNITNLEMVKISQEAENNFIGVACGIMDQFAIGMGRENNAILLNTNTLEYKYVPLKIDDYDIIIMNTKKPRSLITSKYNERKEECDRALDILKKHYNISSICMLKSEDLEEIKKILNDEVLFKRVRHCILENERVSETVVLLKQGKTEEIGKLLNDSHESLKNDYEVSSPELDTICMLALEKEGVIGARMTGAGFGGCAICLCKKDKSKEVIDYVYTMYNLKFNLKPEFYIASSGDGAQRIEENDE